MGELSERAQIVTEAPPSLNRGNLPGQRGFTKYDIYHEKLQWSSSSVYQKEFKPVLPDANGVWILENVTFACFMDTFDTTAGPKPYEQPYMLWGGREYHPVDQNINHTFSSTNGWYFYFCGRIEIGLPWQPGDFIDVVGFTSGASKKRNNFYMHFRRFPDASI